MASEINIEYITFGLLDKGCPVCSHIKDCSFDFLAGWQYQLSASAEARKKFAAETGFCPLHVRQLYSMLSPWGCSAGFSWLADRMTHRLRKSLDENAAENILFELIRVKLHWLLLVFLFFRNNSCEYSELGN